MSQRHKVADVLREVAFILEAKYKAPTTDYANLKKDDWVVVYHGTSLTRVYHLINGFDATQVVRRDYGGPKHAGLFVSPDFKLAERFASYGEIVLELLVPAKNLHGTDYSGRTGRQQGVEHLWDDTYPGSFRSYLSQTLLQGSEPQALLLGLVAPHQIQRVWYNPLVNKGGAWYSRGEFLKLNLEVSPTKDGPYSPKKPLVDFEVDLSSPSLSLDEYLKATAKIIEVDKERVESALKRRLERGEDAALEVIESTGWQPKAAQAFLKLLQATP